MITFLKVGWRGFGAVLPWLEILAAGVAAPLLLFPTVRPTWTAAVLVGLVAVYLLRLVVRREPWPVTPFNGALFLFMLMLPVAVWASAFPDLSLPKLTGLILGLAAFRAVAFFVHDRRRLFWALAAFLMVGLGIWAVGFLGTGWPAKFPVLAPLVRRLPRALLALPGSPDAGINANQLAGALVLYIPIAVSLTVGWLRERRFVAALVALIIGGLFAATLVLTQSRSGWIGGVAGMIGLSVLAAWSMGRKFGRVLALALLSAAIIAVVVLVAIRPDILGSFLGTARDPEGEISLAGRPEIWSRALYAIQDFSFTGTGLGTFRRVVHLLYPLFMISPDIDIAHAHNIFLQVALDVGLPGLIAYLACLWLACEIAWRSARQGSAALRGLALGLLAGLIALHIYGLTDAIALGAKPGLAFWLALGLIAGLAGLHDPGTSSRAQSVSPPTVGETQPC